MKDWKSQVLLKQDKMGMQVSYCHFAEISKKNDLWKTSPKDRRNSSRIMSAERSRIGRRQCIV